MQHIKKTYPTPADKPRWSDVSDLKVSNLCFSEIENSCIKYYACKTT